MSQKQTSMLTMINWKIRRAAKYFFQDLFKLTLILIGFAFVMGIIAAAKFATCYYTDDAKLVRWEQCFKR
jgi:hypothetical protein